MAVGDGVAEAVLGALTGGQRVEVTGGVEAERAAAVGDRDAANRCRGIERAEGERVAIFVTCQFGDGDRLGGVLIGGGVEVFGQGRPICPRRFGALAFLTAAQLVRATATKTAVASLAALDAIVTGIAAQEIGAGFAEDAVVAAAS